jgi:hypothetical protein
LEREKALQANANKKKVEFAEDQPQQLESEKSVRSGERKTTIQLVVDANEKKENEGKPQAPQSSSLFSNPSASQMSSLFKPETAPTITPSPITLPTKN